MKKILSLLTVGAFMLCIVPTLSLAEITVDCSLISSDSTDAVTDGFAPSESPNEFIVEGIDSFNYTADIGSATYTAACNVASDVSLESAPILMAAGLNLDHDTFSVAGASATEYDYTFSGTSAEFYIPGETTATKELVFVFIATVADPTPNNPEPPVGPPASMGGGYIATNTQQFSMEPVEDSDPGMIISLTSTAGADGFFNMYMPSSMLALMSTMSGSTITADDLAIYLDETQASVAVSATDDGGAYLDIDLEFTSGSISTAAKIASTTVTRTVGAKKATALSLASTKARVKRANKVKLFGWLNNKAKGKTVLLQYKKKGAKKYKLFKRLTTKNADGYYYSQFTPKKMQLKKNNTYTFRTKYNVNGNTRRTSDTINVKVVE